MGWNSYRSASGLSRNFEAKLESLAKGTTLYLKTLDGGYHQKPKLGSFIEKRLIFNYLLARRCLLMILVK